MATAKSPGDRHAGAGLSLATPADTPNAEAPTKSQPSLASRALALSSYFLSGALCINLSQFLGTPLYLINRQWYNEWIAFTKQSFGLLTMTLTQTFSPTKVIVSGDKSVRGQLQRNADGTLKLDFPERIVLIANHQIYTDWLYLWWAAYCSGMHGRLYIILKESLKKIPILGWGMQFNQFIFLKRNWEQDRTHMAQALNRLNRLAEPMWLLLFPEGTNLASSTRDKSAKWARKNGIRDMRHCLLPRSTGLRFCLQELQSTVDYLYDCTIAYEGVPRGSYAQDIFTLKAGYIEGRPPKSVSMYWRRFALKDIPLKNEKAFELWLLARWREKDLLIENYLIHGRFPADTGVSKSTNGEVKKGTGHLSVEIRSNHWYEFLQIFAPMGILAMVLYAFYGALPQKFFQSEAGRAVQESAKDLETLNDTVSSKSLPESLNFDMLFDKDKQAQTFGNAGMALAQWIQSPEAKRMMSRADLVQKWLQDPQKVLAESFLEQKEQNTFLESLKQEEERRRRLVNKHQGTFWRDIEAAESEVASRSKTTSRKGSFYKELANKEANKNAQKLSAAALQSKANFWDELEKEAGRRNGSVFTLPTLTSSDTPTAFNSIDSRSTTVIGSQASIKRKPPKLGPKKPAPSSASPKNTATVKPARTAATDTAVKRIPSSINPSSTTKKSAKSLFPLPEAARPLADSRKKPPKLKPRTTAL